MTADGTNIQGVYIDADNGNGNIGDNIPLCLSQTYAPFASVNKGTIIVIYNGNTTKDPYLPAEITTLQTVEH